MPHQKLFRTASAFLAVVAATLCLFEGQCSSGQQAATATLRAHAKNITSLVFAPNCRTLASGKKLGRFVVPRATVVSSGRKLNVVAVTGSNQAAIETGEARDWFG